jgi:uncharacterized membrane protein
MSHGEGIALLLCLLFIGASFGAVVGALFLPAMPYVGVAVGIIAGIACIIVLYGAFSKLSDTTFPE